MKWQSTSLCIWRSGWKIKELHDLVLTLATIVQSFGPDHVIIHVGHNDVCMHETKNPKPIGSPDAVNLVEAFIRDVELMLPKAVVHYSVPFPRKAGQWLSAERALKYNKLAARMGREARHRGLQVLFAFELWASVMGARADPQYLDVDGLHLTPGGKRRVAVTSLSEKSLQGL